MSQKLKSINLPYRYFVFFYLVISTILRVVLWASYGIQENISLLALPCILMAGLVQDLIALLFLLLPLSILRLLPSRIVYSKFAQVFASVFCFLIIFFGLFLLPAEFLFFDEFDSRFNLVAVDYFAYPTEVAGNIWESYPIVWLILGLLLLTFPIWSWVWRRIKPFFDQPESLQKRSGLFVLHFFAAICFVFFGSINFLVDDHNRVRKEITRNGILTFFLAIATNDIEFDHFYATLNEEKAFSLMRRELKEKGGEFTSDNIYNLERRFPSKANGLGKMNVVIIGEESLGAQFIGALGDKRGLSPNFDNLSSKGLLFENVFATGTRTVRGLEAISMSLPPIPSESIVKRPNNEDMANLGVLLNAKGYTSSFIYGGFGAFDNMNYFFGNNGFNLSDRLSIKKITFSNIWGVCDEDLFHHAIEFYNQISQSERPFLSIIMTTSNHKPFSFRPGVPGVPETGGGREAGVRYADFALGEFFEYAEKTTWFKNTLFVVVGDHDSRVYGRANIPVERFRVALAILAPGRIEPRRITNVTSHIDLIPTIMGILGLPYQGPFYGRDVLDPEAPLSQPVLLNYNHDVALYENQELAVSSLNRELNSYKYTEDKKTIEIDDNIQMQELLTAYLQTSYSLYRGRKYKLTLE